MALARIASVARTRTFGALSQVASPEFRAVKFEQEELSAVMQEVPDFNFYEIPDEIGVNPYRDASLSQAVAAETPKEAIDQNVQCSVLENGLRIVSVDKGGPVSNLGLFANAGSRLETQANAGVSHMVELMAFRSTAHLSHLRTAKTFEQLGATVRCEVGRETTVYKSNVLREYMPVIVPLLVGNVLFPRLLQWEFSAIKGKVVEAQNELKAHPDNYVSELIHQTAFHNNTLGNSLLSTPLTLHYVDEVVVRNYLMQHFSCDKMVFVGVNVNHDELCKWLMRSFADYNSIPPQENAVTPPKYTGGYRRIFADLPHCHIALGFNVQGGFNGDDALATSLLQTILGDSDTLASKLNSQVGSVVSSMAFSHLYTDAGLVGAYAMIDPSQAENWVQETCNQLKNFSVSSEEMTRAKNALKLSASQSFNDCHALVDELGSQLILGRKISTPEQLHSLIDQISESDVTQALRGALSSKPTLVAYGNVSYVPHYDDVVAAIRS
eukprot:GEMP01024043.1.p1 GENE.GEMP01024043.1~~GEMP01024043.1.p1  ORF type:complete len:496 (+),score=93.97 GEMP01024043.1:146-1633(+)